MKVMEAFSRFRKILPYGARYISVKYASGRPTDATTVQSAESQPTEDKVIIFSCEGDTGYSTVNYVSLPKNNRIFDAIGNTDELICHLGVARENAISNKHPYSDKITRIQTLLFDIVLAISKQSSETAFPEKNTRELEEWIQQYSKDLSPAENYLLPGGGKVSTSLHVARSVCRRAERSVFPLVRDGQLDKEVQAYFNRLADLLFTWARFAAKRDERSESVYTPKSESKKKDMKQETVVKQASKPDS